MCIRDSTYFVGMSSLALQLLYRRFNAEEDVVCERIFWEKGAAQAGKPLLSLESGAPAADFAVWAFTISWEMDYFNVVELLRQAKIPPLAADRQSSTQWDGPVSYTHLDVYKRQCPGCDSPAGRGGRPRWRSAFRPCPGT